MFRALEGRALVGLHFKQDEIWSVASSIFPGNEVDARSLIMDESGKIRDRDMVIDISARYGLFELSHKGPVSQIRERVRSYSGETFSRKISRLELRALWNGDGEFDVDMDALCRMMGKLPGLALIDGMTLVNGLSRNAEEQIKRNDQYRVTSGITEVFFFSPALDRMALSLFGIDGFNLKSEGSRLKLKGVGNEGSGFKFIFTPKAQEEELPELSLDLLSRLHEELSVHLSSG